MVANTKENTSPEWAIEIRNVTKSFGNHRALRGVNLNIERGEFLTLLGHNGAGKTTLLRVLATLLKPTSGDVCLEGISLKDNAGEIRRRIGVVAHQTFLYDDLTAYENLKFYGTLYNVPNLHERIPEVCTAAGIASRLHDKVRTLSRGMQQRVSIARAVIHSPQIMLLDEPDTGLDQHASLMLKEMLDTFNPGNQTVVMVTHNLQRGFDMANRLLILSHGKTVFDQPKQSITLSDLQQAFDQHCGAQH